jgi:large subunit ribosomal protein L21
MQAQATWTACGNPGTLVAWAPVRSICFLGRAGFCLVERAMYAVFEDGSRQYRVAEGDIVTVDFCDKEIGSAHEFDKVLLLKTNDGLTIGQPLVAGAKVLAEVVEHPTTKVTVQHFRRRKNYRRFRGHRQPYTRLRIRSIVPA